MIKARKQGWGGDGPTLLVQRFCHWGLGSTEWGAFSTQTITTETFPHCAGLETRHNFVLEHRVEEREVWPWGFDLASGVGFFC